MNELQIFQDSEFGELGVLMIDNEAYFPATECGKLLGYANPHKAIGDHCRYLTKRRVPHPQNPGKVIVMNFIPEGDLYRLITHSKLPAAERFERWVFDEVLPAIRRHGLYALDELIQNPDLAIKALIALKEEREARRLLECQVERDKPFTWFGKAIAANSDAILIGDFAKLACNNDIHIGRNRLFKWLRDHGYLMHDNMPYQRYVDQGLFAVKEASITTMHGAKIVTTTLVTGKGQMVLLDALQKSRGILSIEHNEKDA